MSQAPSHQMLENAKTQTEQVQRELEVASAELGLTHGALQRELPADVKKLRDVAWAITQNKLLELKVQKAADKLEEVAEMIEQAQGDA